MEKYVTRIDIILENVDVFTLKPKHFKQLSFANITRDLNINCCQFKKGEIIEHLQCSHFTIKILKNAFSIMGAMEDKVLSKRFLTEDVVSVDVFYSDGTEENVVVPYEGQFINKLQKNTITEDAITIYIIEK